MHICLVINARIPVHKYGGTERIVQWLANEFVKANHQVTLVGLPGCDLPGVTCIAATNAQEAQQAIPDSVDIVHFHAWEPQHTFRKPWIYTLHGNSTTPETLPKIRSVSVQIMQNAMVVKFLFITALIQMSLFFKKTKKIICCFSRRYVGASKVRAVP
jgi:hypothetical protein